MGLSGISKSQVSKLCKDIDERGQPFLDRPLDGEWPYLWLDATYLKVRDGGRIVSVAAIIAVAVTTTLGTPTTPVNFFTLNPTQSNSWSFDGGTPYHNASLAPDAVERLRRPM